MHGKRIPAKLDEDTLLSLDVNIDDSVIEQGSSHKILGVVIDSQMNYESHIDELCKKLSKRIGLLKHISPFLKQRQRETYYQGTKLTFLARSHLAPKFSKVVAKAKKLGAIKKKDSWKNALYSNVKCLAYLSITYSQY